jgi:hypothetical protein
MKAQAGLVPPNCPSNKVLQRQMSVPSKGLKSNVSWQVKSHLIQEPPKHVHQNYLIKLNKCSKTLWNLSSLGMGGLSMWPIRWVIPQVKNFSPSGPSLSHVKTMKWMGSWQTRVCIVSFMGSFVEGELHLHFQCILFPNQFIVIN